MTIDTQAMAQKIAKLEAELTQAKASRREADPLISEQIEARLRKNFDDALEAAVQDQLENEREEAIEEWEETRGIQIRERMRRTLRTASKKRSTENSMNF